MYVAIYRHIHKKMDEDIPQQAPAKRARTEAQQKAFASMIAARDRKAYERVKQSEEVAVPEQVQQEEKPAAVVEANKPMQMTYDEADVHVPTHTQPAQSQHVAHAAAMDDGDEPDYEFLEVDDLMQQLHQTRDELMQLKEQFSGLHSAHGTLAESFTQHGIRQKHEINFV